MKHLRTIPTICPSVLKTLLKLTADPRSRAAFAPLASPSFLQRVTTTPKPIVRRSDGQLMLTALLEPAAGEVDARPG